MPVTQSAKRALRVSRRKEARNKRVRNAYKSIISRVRTGKEKSLAQVYRQLDRAAKRGVIHRRKAARLKSRLAKLIKPVATSKSSKPKATKLK